MVTAVVIAVALIFPVADAACKQQAIGDWQSMVCPPVAEGPGSGKCLLIIPGRGNDYNFANVFSGIAASGGYASLAIEYYASPDTYSTCYKDYNDLDCGYKFRLAKQIGGPGVHGHSVPESQSIEFRTKQALHLLANMTDGHPTPVSDPTPWAKCLTAEGEIKWSSIVVMGGSEGSGQAAFAGYHRSVDRVIQFSGIDDGVVYDLNAGKYDPPKWATTKGATPYSRYYGFGELYDQACRAWRLNWGNRAFDMPGDWVNFNLLAPDAPLDTYHKICSDRTKNTGGHLTTVWDRATPKVDGKYVYEPIWRHHLGLPLTFNSTRFGELAPTPITAGTPVDVADCDTYPSIKQRWSWDPATGTLSLIDSSPKLVLDCGACTGADREMTVSTLNGAPTTKQTWSFERNHFVHKASKLCLARKPRAEPGLVVLASCTETPLENTAWKISTETHHVTSANVCLAVRHANTTKCQCVF